MYNKTETCLLQIYNTIVTKLLPSLKYKSQDIELESLRVFILLPMYAEFEARYHHKTLQSVFAKAFLKLNSTARTVVGECAFCISPITSFILLLSYTFASFCCTRYSDSYAIFSCSLIVTKLLIKQKLWNYRNVIVINNLLNTI
jgi:hypothetical protein